MRGNRVARCDGCGVAVVAVTLTKRNVYAILNVEVSIDLNGLA